MTTGHAPRRLAQQGFSLLEAIVALTVMATCLLALYGWLFTSTFSLNRARDSALALQDARAAMALVETVNPMAQPNGSREISSLQVRWKARPLTDRRIGMSRAGTPTQFDFRLYEMNVEVLRNNAVVTAFNVRRTGWEAARPIFPDDE